MLDNRLIVLLLDLLFDFIEIYFWKYFGTENGEDYRVIFFIAPLIVYFPSCVVIFCYVLIKLRNLKKLLGTSSKVANNYNFRRQMAFYVLVFIITWTPSMILKIMELTTYHVPTWFKYWEATSISIVGFANSLVWFFFNPSFSPPCKLSKDKKQMNEMAEQPLLVN